MLLLIGIFLRYRRRETQTVRNAVKL